MTLLYWFRLSGDGTARPFRPARLIGPVKDPLADDVHEDGNAVDQADRQDLAVVRFHADDEDDRHVEMEVAEQEDQPDAAEGEVPEGVFPDEVAADVQQAFHEHAEDRIADRPEPAVRNPQDPLFLVLGKGMVEDDPGDGEHEHDLDVPSDHGAQGRVAGGGPEGRVVREMEHPAVPGLVEEIHAEKGQTGEDGIPVPRLPRLLHLRRVDVEDDGQQRDHVPLEHRQVPQPVQGSL